jgi:hypothetical protein
MGVDTYVLYEYIMVPVLVKRLHVRLLIEHQGRRHCGRLGRDRRLYSYCMYWITVQMYACTVLPAVRYQIYVTVPKREVRPRRTNVEPCEAASLGAPLITKVDPSQ